jgi:hypothetical protein
VTDAPGVHGGYDDGDVSLTRFLVLTTMYILIFGVVTGGLAAWTTRAGASPLRHLTAAFRSRGGSPP